MCLWSGANFFSWLMAAGFRKKIYFCGKCSAGVPQQHYSHVRDLNDTKMTSTLIILFGTFETTKPFSFNAHDPTRAMGQDRNKEHGSSESWTWTCSWPPVENFTTIEKNPIFPAFSLINFLPSLSSKFWVWQVHGWLLVCSSRIPLLASPELEILSAWNAGTGRIIPNSYRFAGLCAIMLEIDSLVFLWNNFHRPTVS